MDASVRKLTTWEGVHGNGISSVVHPKYPSLTGIRAGQWATTWRDDSGSSPHLGHRRA